MKRTVAKKCWTLTSKDIFARVTSISPVRPFAFPFILLQQLELFRLIQIILQCFVTDERTRRRQDTFNDLDTLLEILTASLAEQEHWVVCLLIRYHKL